MSSARFVDGQVIRFYTQEAKIAVMVGIFFPPPF